MERTGLRARLLSHFFVGFSLLFAARAVEAGCCRIIRIDPETPTPVVRVCEPDAAGACGTVLFEGSLALGESRTVCATGVTIGYQDVDATTGIYGPRTDARCDAADVEL
ncbi:MAG: hypothetical protein HYR72_09400 [Deltaproteobacteria bacterium]|nr:hypothetical protein [Deltaproteobacteria bacterium]MBI3387914.1 hypothetical protein [Deltaproteobacteria bacterium]